jgi:CBS domain-containing protein
VKIESVMTRDVVTVRANTPLKEVAQRLVEHAISGLPVVSDDGEVVGVISEADLLVKESGAAPRKRGIVASLLNPSDPHVQVKLEARLAGEAMTSPPVTIAPFQSTAAAASEMLEAGINRLPVVQDGQLVGIVTRADLVRAFARSDAQVAGEVRHQAEFFLALAEDVAKLDVSCVGGEVTVTGRVKRRSNAEELPRFLARVPGVVAVASELTWQEDDTKPQHERAGSRFRAAV